LKKKAETRFRLSALTYICVTDRSTIARHEIVQRMKPRSVRADARSAFCFFSNNAIAAESVRGLTTVSPGAATLLDTVSLQLRRSYTERVAHPDRSSFDAGVAGTEAAGFSGTHLPVAAALAVHAFSRRPAARAETEYISAASDDTATASSNNATSSSPITKPRRRPRRGLCSPIICIPPSYRPRCCEA
jgi:hypothetical protein